MKAIKIIAVLSLLVIFPAISYLYLMKGYNFRLGALQELEDKMEVENFDYSPLTSETLDGKATLVFNADSPEARAYLEPVFEEFSHREEFQMIGFTEDSLRLGSFPKSGQWLTVVHPYPYDKDISLIDTSHTIRNYYQLDSASFTKLIQHIPIIIPRKKEKDIVLRRDDEK